MKVTLFEFMLLYIVGMLTFAIVSLISMKVIRYLEKKYRGEL